MRRRRAPLCVSIALPKVIPPPESSPIRRRVCKGGRSTRERLAPPWNSRGGFFHLGRAMERKCVCKTRALVLTRFDSEAPHEETVMKKQELKQKQTREEGS